MSESVRRVRPTPIGGFLANPHRGCCTFQRFEGDELYPSSAWSEEGPTTFPPRAHPGHAPRYLPTTVAYCRWFWSLVEPDEGAFDFTAVERARDTAAARGQTLAIRVMPHGDAGQPPLPAWYVAKYPTQREEPRGIVRPIHDSPEYLERFGAVIRALGARFDGDPLIESVDVGYIGPWGEGDGDCSDAQCARFNAVHRDAFPTTPRLVEICGHQGRHGIEAGCGFRLNGFGDLSDGGDAEVLRANSWNHHFDVYPQDIVAAGARDAWRTRPIHFETAAVPMDWHRAGWDLGFILEQGLKFHITCFMPKSCPLPEAWLAPLGAFCERIGYRFVFRQAIVPTAVAAGAAFRLRAWIENVGIAPLYRPYRLAVRLRQRGREDIALLDDDVRAWLPGDAIVDAPLRAPAWLRPGGVELAVGLVDERTRQARVSFAAKEVFADRWLSLGTMAVEAD